MVLPARKVSGAFEKQAPGQGNYVVFLGKTLNSQCASLYPRVYLGTGEFNAGGN